MQRTSNLARGVPNSGISEDSREGHFPRGKARGDEASDEAQQRHQRRRRTGVATDLTQIKAILSKALAQRGLDKKVERYEFVLHWKEIVGDSLAHVSKPEYISNRALIVKVAHSGWAQELAFMKPIIIQRIAPYLKRGDLIHDIIFRVGQIR